MKTVCKKLLCLMLVAMLLVSAVPAAFAAESVTITYQVKSGTSNDVVKTTTMNYGLGDEIHASKYVEGVLGVDVSEITAVWYEATGKTINGGEAQDAIFTCEGAGRIVVRINGETASDDSDDTTTGGDDDTIETNNVTFTIYEVDADGNAKDGGTKTVNVNAYASEYELVKAIYGSAKFQDYKLNISRGTLHIYALKSENGKAVYQLKVMHNNGTSDYTLIDVYEDEGVLAAIKAASIKMKQHVDGDEYKLMGYSTKMTTDDGDYAGHINAYTRVSDLTIKNGVATIYADWRETSDDDDEDYEYGDEGGLYGDDNDDPIYDVVLYIYTNGKTSSPAKTIKASAMGKYTKDGILTDDEVEIVVKNYFKTTNDTKYYGLFTKYYWNDGDYLTANAKASIKLDPDQTNYVYVMVKNAKAYVADSSNPKTGDNIMIAVTGMTLAAAGLVSMIELKKRKMI